MAAVFDTDAGAQAANLALRMGSDSADAMSFAAELGEELPFVGPVLKTLKAIRGKLETVKSNRAGLTALEVRCRYVTACVVVKCGQTPGSEMDVTPLEDCVEAVGELVKRCTGRGRVSRVLKASSDKDDIAGLNARIDSVAGDLSLAGVAILEGKTDVLTAMLERMSSKQEVIVGHLQRSPVMLANIPKGTPARKSWHVERRRVMNAAFGALRAHGGPGLVGLVGQSGSGKTTAASEIVRSTEVREAFSDGIVWLTVNDGATERLPSLMLQLARVVYEDVGSSVGDPPKALEDGAAYVKKYVEKGHGGKGLRCLVVADNVWEEAVVSKLLDTGMWVLLSTRDGNLVSGVHGEAVGVAELSEADAESLLRRTAELPPDVRLPDDAVDLIGLCGRVAMDLAFVGRWSTVRGRQDRTAWSDAAGKVRAAMGTVVGDDLGDDRRRRAILQAGFEDLAIGSDDERVQRLYLSLAVMPDSRAFTVKDAAILLYDREPSPEDETSVRGVLDILERWTIIQSTEGGCRMHDTHSNFARQNLMDRGDVRRPALRRWVRYISSLDTLRSIDHHVLKSLWVAVEQAGGDGWSTTRPYEASLAVMDESDPLLLRLRTLERLGFFQEAQEDWERASNTARRLLEVEKRELGSDHPYVLVSYWNLAELADRRGNAEEAATWRMEEREQLPLALVRVNNKTDQGRAERVGFADALASLASSVLRLTPEDRDKAENLLRISLGFQEANLGTDDVEVAGVLSRLSDCVRESGRLEEAEQLLRRCLAIQEGKLGQTHVKVAHTLVRLVDCVQEAGRLEEAGELMRRCLAIKEATLGSEGELMASTLVCLCHAICVGQEGRLDEAEALLRRCLAIQEAKLGPDGVKVANTLCHLGGYVREAGRLDDAEALLRRCLAIREATLGPGVEVANTLCHLGECIREAGRLDEAEALLRHCLAMKEAKLGPEDVGVADTVSQLGVWVQEAGRLEEAELLMRRCLAIRETKLGPEDLQVARTLYQLGMCIRKAGRLEEAEDLLRRCLAIEEAKLDPEDVGVAFTLFFLGSYAREAGRLEEAEELLRRCLGIREATLGAEDDLATDWLYLLGVWVQETGRLNEAEALLRRCLAMKEAKLGPEDLQVARTLYQLGMCIRKAGRLEEAEDLLRRCLAIEEAKLDPEDVGVAFTLHQLGTCVRTAGRLEEAEELLRRCLAIVEAQPVQHDLDLARTLHEMAVCVRGAGRPEEAEELLRRILGIVEANLCRQDAEAGSTLDRQTRKHNRQQQEWLEKAKKCLQECFGIDEAELGYKGPDMDKLLHELGFVLREAGKLS